MEGRTMKKFILAGLIASACTLQAMDWDNMSYVQRGQHYATNIVDGAQLFVYVLAILIAPDMIPYAQEKNY